MADEGFSEKQLVQLRTIVEGERFHTEKMIDRKLNEALKPIHTKLDTIVENTTEDIDVLASDVLKQGRQIAAVKKQVAPLIKSR